MKRVEGNDEKCSKNIIFMLHMINYTFFFHELPQR